MGKGRSEYFWKMGFKRILAPILNQRRCSQFLGEDDEIAEIQTAEIAEFFKKQ